MNFNKFFDVDTFKRLFSEETDTDISVSVIDESVSSPEDAIDTLPEIIDNTNWEIIDFPINWEMEYSEPEPVIPDETEIPYQTEPGEAIEASELVNFDEPPVDLPIESPIEEPEPVIPDETEIPYQTEPGPGYDIQPIEDVSIGKLYYNTSDDINIGDIVGCVSSSDDM